MEPISLVFAILAGMSALEAVVNASQKQRMVPSSRQLPQHPTETIENLWDSSLWASMEIKPDTEIYLEREGDPWWGATEEDWMEHGNPLFGDPEYEKAWKGMLGAFRGLTPPIQVRSLAYAEAAIFFIVEVDVIMRKGAAEVHLETRLVHPYEHIENCAVKPEFIQGLVQIWPNVEFDEADMVEKRDYFLHGTDFWEVMNRIYELYVEHYLEFEKRFNNYFPTMEIRG